MSGTGTEHRFTGLEVHLGVEAEFSPARKAHPGILVDGIDELAARLTDRDVDVTWDDDFPGHRRFYTSDRLGNRLEFLQPHTGPPGPRRDPESP